MRVGWLPHPALYSATYLIDTDAVGVGPLRSLRMGIGG